MTRRILGALLVVVALILAPAAQAAPLTMPEVEAEYAAALTWWGVSSPPQCQVVELKIAPTDPYFAEGRAPLQGDARATQPGPGEVVALCVVEVYEDRMAPMNACQRQMVFRHEDGHLLGYGHSEDLTSIMYGGTDSAWFDVGCPPPVEAAPAPEPPPIIRFVHHRTHHVHHPRRHDRRPSFRRGEPIR